MPFCSKCGHPLENEAKFCSSCGTPLGATPQSAAVSVLPSPSQVKRSGRSAVWAVGAFLLLICLGALLSVIDKQSGSTDNKHQTASGVTAIPATYDEAKKVITLCGKPSQDRPQQLSAGAGSEGRALVYRKYDTELWFYRGPASSQWMLMNAFKASGDDAITVDEANQRMPCLKGSLQEHFREPHNAAEQAAAEQGQIASQKAEAAQKAADDKQYSELSTRAGIGAASLRAAARNPDSLVLEKVIGMHDGTVCYEYRAQNGFGGMNRDVAVLLPNAESLTTSATEWNSHCAHKNGYDLKLVAEQLMKVVPQ